MPMPIILAKVIWPVVNPATTVTRRRAAAVMMPPVCCMPAATEAVSSLVVVPCLADSRQEEDFIVNGIFRVLLPVMPAFVRSVYRKNLSSLKATLEVQPTQWRGEVE